jgi:hypothetical protein
VPLTFKLNHAIINSELVNLVYGVPRWNFWLGHYKKGTDIMTDRKFLNTLYFSMFLSGVGMALAIVVSYCRVDEQTNTVATEVDIHQNLPGLSGYKQIGWCQMVGGVNREPESGINYVVVSLSGDTNDFTSLRVCYVDTRRYRQDYARYDDKTNEVVFVVSYVATSTDQPTYLVQCNGATRERNNEAH